MTLWRALRRDPAHAPDTAVLYALPQLSPHVVRWRRSTAARHPHDSSDELARRVLHRSITVARRGGAITGSTFYVALLPAMAMIYCEQLVVLLRIAAIYGRDPTDPARVPEILVIQGRYRSVAAATKALSSERTAKRDDRDSTRVRAMTRSLRQLPSMIGLQLKLKARSPIDVVIGIVELLSFVIPVVSIPVWAVANARATRRLGRAAVNFYAVPPTDTGIEGELSLPPRAKPWVRWLLIGTVVPLALALGFLFGRLLNGPFHHLHWVAFALSELALVITFARLIQLTGGATGHSSPPGGESGAWSVPSGPSRVEKPGTEEMEHLLRRPVSVIDVDLETRTGRCATHGEVEATRERPRLQFPFLITGVRRVISRWRPFRCPSCRERVTTS